MHNLNCFSHCLSTAFVFERVVVVVVASLETIFYMFLELHLCKCRNRTSHIIIIIIIIVVFFLVVHLLYIL